MTNKILLVDDSKTQLDIQKLRFQKSGFEVETAQDALEGYRKTFEFAPDAILSDIIMPNIDGYQFCRLLKSNTMTKNIPVILLTVLDKNLDKFWGKTAGAEKFISKTTDFEEIKAITEKIIKEHPVTDGEKEYLKTNIPKDVSVSEQINEILNELLKESIFLNEFRNLGEYYSHETVLVQKCFDLFSTFIDYDIAELYFKPIDINSKNIIYTDMKEGSVSRFVIEKIKRDFIAQMPDLPELNSNNFELDVVRENENCEDKINNFNVIKTNFVLPIMFENKLLGGIAFLSKEEKDYTKLKSFNVLKNELQGLLKMKSLYSEVEYLSVTDGLTGLYNRRLFDFNIEREFLRAKRYKNNLSLAILDIDFFKKVNDTYGHQYGDYVLREVSKLMKESFRKTDMLYRYGGEELTIIMPETSLGNAVIPLERLRVKIANHTFSFEGTDINLTVSIGISTMKETYINQKEIVETADKALYEAKGTGRNKVVIYNEQLNDD